MEIEVRGLEAGWYRLSVSDTGEGIPDELLPQLFGAFERLGATG